MRLAETDVSIQPSAAGERPDIVLHLHALACGYDGKAICGPLEFSLEAGTFMLIEGPNGIGKSTLLKTLVGLLQPVSGAVEWHVADNARRFVPQTRTVDPILPATVTDVVATGMQDNRNWLGFRARRHKVAFRQALAQVGMEAFQHELFRELSEGQKQLVLLARALLGQPSVLLLDEPAASMDPNRAEHAIEVLRQQQRQHGTTIVMIAHGLGPAQRAAEVLLRFDHRAAVQVERRSVG